MAHENKILHISLFVGLVSFLAGGVDAAVRIGNKTKNDVYRQIVAANAAATNNAVGTATTNTATEPELPVRVANADLAREIQSGTSSIDTEQLNSCAQIYPNGVFAWDKPTAGVGAGGAATCVSVVELRGYQMGPGGTDVVLARANVAAGSGVKCNISDFPEANYTIDAQNVLFPADAEPTTEDVIKVLNQEQKQNAGMKIAAATLVGAIGGNIAGPNDVGKDSIIGTDKGKMKGTLIGALSGAAIGTGGAYAGKVGGDMIMSTGINAAAGGVVGNIMATGDPVLRIEDCTDDTGTNKSKCLWGYINEGTTMSADNDGKMCDKSGKCVEAFFDLIDRNYIVCEGTSCIAKPMAFVKIKLDEQKGTLTEVNALKETEIDHLKMGEDVYWLEKNSNGTSRMVKGSNSEKSHPYVRIYSAIFSPTRKPALIWNMQDKFFGMKRSDWYKWKTNNSGDVQIYRRDTHGNATGANLGASELNNFEPMYVSAEDGGIIDLDNKARLKGTMIGAGAGGALGAFTAYQGAQSDIDERWVAAVREYKDSLQKFYCATGSRFLSYYNDLAVIPNVDE